MTATTIALAGLTGVLVLMTSVWLASLGKRDASIIDSFWGLAFVFLAWLYFGLGSQTVPRQLLVPVLVTLWGLRLSLYISWRNWGHGEDPRYAAMRAKYGAKFPWLSLIIVFWFQGLLAWIIAAPLWKVQVADGPPGLNWLDVLGTLVFFVGLIFETTADLQLARFRANTANRGKVLDRGLWCYSRHPNYFGEALVWWGLFLIVLSTPGAWWTVLSPVLITFLLLRVSGVTLLEDSLKTSKPGYREYIERTSAFFPWFPRRVVR
jgi:steroid 5-alpha reductase family enzyme